MTAARPDDIPGDYAIIALPNPGGKHKHGKTGQQTSRDWRKARAAERLRTVVEARLGGASWKECAERAGYANAGTAYRTFHKWLDAQPMEDVDRYRRLMLMRLDRMLERVWDFASGDRPSPRAMELVLAIEDRRAKLLGVDKNPPLAGEQQDADVLALARRYSGLNAEEVEAEIRRLSWVVSDGGQTQDDEDTDGGKGTAAGRVP